MLFKRLLCTQTAAPPRHRHRQQWPVKQVTKSNFSEALGKIKNCIFNSDFVAVSLQKTGGHSAPWQKILPIDTAETAYIKAKRTAERFQIFQFAVCPFSVKANKLIAHPYNFHLFPRDELKVGMPCYSFSCQSSYLTAMAREGFDFNGCIYNGISYLSRSQESVANVKSGHLSSTNFMVQSSSVNSLADSLFTERIKSRVKNWINSCKDSNKTDGVTNALISSLRKIVSGSELYGSRPSLLIDVCSERQVQLALETLKEFVDVVPLQAPVKGFGVQAVRVVLTSSKEDKNLLEKELQDMEEEKRIRFCGFRDVIDLIATSQKPIVAHNSLNDFTFIHSKFLYPLPSTMDEFRSSLLSLFPHILDVNHLMKEIGPFEKMNNIPAAISYLDSRFFAPIDIDFSNQAVTDNVNIHGHNVVRVCQLFVKLCAILKISPEVSEDDHSQLSPSLERRSNIFNPCSSNSRDPFDDDVKIWTGKSKTVSTDNLVFVWGFESGISARTLKNILSDSHDVFSEEFDVRMVDRTCAIIVFWTRGFSERFLRTMDSGEIRFSDKLKDMVSEGMKAAGYDTYKRVCESGLWKQYLAECLDLAMDETEIVPGVKLQQEQSVIFWINDEMINLDEL